MGVGAGVECAVGAFTVSGIGATVVALAVRNIPPNAPARVDAARRRGRRGGWQGRLRRQARPRLLADVSEWAGSAVVVALEHGPPPVLPVEVHVIRTRTAEVLKHCRKPPPPEVGRPRRSVCPDPRTRPGVRSAQPQRTVGIQVPLKAEVGKLPQPSQAHRAREVATQRDACGFRPLPRETLRLLHAEATHAPIAHLGPLGLAFQTTRLAYLAHLTSRVAGGRALYAVLALEHTIAVEIEVGAGAAHAVCETVDSARAATRLVARGGTRRGVGAARADHARLRATQELIRPNGVVAAAEAERAAFIRAELFRVRRWRRWQWQIGRRQR